jgi:pimeloyl-ACP methyl ester carboxylesterase
METYGTGRPVLLLHGGAGPASVTGFARLLADTLPVRVTVPVHPGFDGTPRPPELDGIPALAASYTAQVDLADTVVIGNSIGAWVAAEIALRHPPGLAGLVLVDAVGAEVPGHPVVDFFSLTPAQILERSWYEPGRAPVVTPAPGNRDALLAYGGTAMTDPGLLARLSGIDVPTRVVWGAADRIADPAYGRAVAAAIPGADFVLLPRTGHVPQLETPDALLAALAPVLT